MGKMRITIENDEGSVQRYVCTEQGNMDSDSITWPDAVRTVLDMLLGLSYCYRCSTEELVDALEIRNGRD